MSSATTTTSIIEGYVDNKTFLNILAPFGIPIDKVTALCNDTSAVFAGGAVTNFIALRIPEAVSRYTPDPHSDLDFWVYIPGFTRTCGTAASISAFAFRNLVIKRATELLQPFGYSYYDNPFLGRGYSGKVYKTYDDAINDFRIKGGITIGVRWFYNEAINRTVNLIFTDTPIVDTISKFDLPICRGIIDCRLSPWRFQVDKQMIDDLREGLLMEASHELHGAKTDARTEKYMQRYGLSLRPPVTPVTPITLDAATPPHELEHTRKCSGTCPFHC